MNVEKLVCEYIIGMPCDCNKHYVFKKFNSKEEFLKGLNEACNEMDGRSDRPENFPLISAIPSSKKVHEKSFLFIINACDSNKNPFKIEWKDEMTLSSIKKTGYDESEIFAFLTKYETMKFVKESNSRKFYDKCTEIVN